MKPPLHRALTSSLALALAAPALAVEPPGVLSHQGRVAVHGVNYDGTGYFKFALVDANASETFWTNDGTNTGAPGGVPDTAVPVAISKGNYALGLGDSSLPNMNDEVPASVFATQQDVRLRIWFSTDDATFELLAPDRRITSAGYAFAAAHVDGGSIANPSFLGTTDNTPLEFLANSTRGLHIRLEDGVPVVIGGASHNTVAPLLGGATIGGGGENGSPNAIAGAGRFGTISGGRGNTVSGDAGAVGGGENNHITAAASVGAIAGGARNTVSDLFGAIGGGTENSVSGLGSVVAGGQRNTAAGNRSVVGGGLDNEASGNGAVVPGGSENLASGSLSFAGGYRAKALHPGAFVWSDTFDSDSDFASTAANQFLVRASGGVGIGTTQPSATLHVFSSENPSVRIQSDRNDEIAGRLSLCQANGSGYDLFYDGTSAAEQLVLQPVLSGAPHGRPALTMNLSGRVDVGTSLSVASRIGIGTSSPAEELHVHTTGTTNPASIRISNDQTLGFLYLQRNEDGQAYLYNSDAKALNIGTANAADLTIAANGRVGIGNRTPVTKLDVAGEICCTAMNLTSDRNAKRDFVAVDAQDVLERVSGMPISRWRYKSEVAESDAVHIGPMAQDFHAAFGVGRDDRHIASVDADGVALAAIQGLKQLVDEKDRRIQQLEERMGRLERILQSRTGATQ